MELIYIYGKPPAFRYVLRQSRKFYGVLILLPTRIFRANPDAGQSANDDASPLPGSRCRIVA